MQTEKNKPARLSSCSQDTGSMAILGSMTMPVNDNVSQWSFQSMICLFMGMAPTSHDHSTTMAGHEMPTTQSQVKLHPSPKK